MTTTVSLLITTATVHTSAGTTVVPLPYPMTGAEVALWAESTYGTPLGVVPAAAAEPGQTTWLFLSVYGEIVMVDVADV